MFSIGNYRVQFSHTNRDFLILTGKELKEVCGVTTCRIKDLETGELKIGATVLCSNGDNNSKNNRRKKTLAGCLQVLFPSDRETTISNPSKSSWNKKARTLFWEAYAGKRGGLEDQIKREEEDN